MGSAHRVSEGSGDRGQALPLVALLVVVGAGAAVLVAALGGLVVDRTRARTAADAAALAGAVGGRDPAEQMAAANGGILHRYVEVGDEVEVTVRVGRAEATARARSGPPRRRSAGFPLVDSPGDDRASAHRRGRHRPTAAPARPPVRSP